MLSRSRRADERGQTLVFAVVMLAFFGLVAASVLTFASTTEAQRGSTERTAALESVADGSAQFALADTRGRACGTVSGGTLQFPSTIRGDRLTYHVSGCQPSASGGIAAGSSCRLCLLNTPAPNPSTPVLISNAGVTVNGSVDANGTISGALTAGGAEAGIGLLDGATCSSCSPEPTSLPHPFNDPLAGMLPIPTSGGSAQKCSACGVIGPGVYSRIRTAGSTVWMKAGIYIVTGQVDVAGDASRLTNADASTGSTMDSDSGGPRASGPGTYTADTVVDRTKSWARDQWAGSVVSVTLSDNSIETGLVAGNDDDTLTLTRDWATKPAAGDRYVVSTLGYTRNTLVDTSMSWQRDQWKDAVVKVTLSNNSTETGIVASNDDDTLTLTSNWVTLPSPGNAYVVSTLGYTSNTLVDTTKHWTPNQWAGADVTVTRSNKPDATATVGSNTANTLTMTSNWASTPSPGDTYSVVAPVAIYLTCNTPAPYRSCRTTGQSGGSLDVAADGTLAVSPSSHDPYPGISLFTDPDLTDPAGGSVVSISGSSVAFGGTVHVPRGSVSISGRAGTQVTIAGRLIVQRLSISVREGDRALTLTGTAPPVGAASCSYYSDGLAGIEGNGTRRSAQVQFETGCASAGLNGQGGTSPTSIIGFAYSPAP